MLWAVALMILSLSAEAQEREQDLQFMPTDRAVVSVQAERAGAQISLPFFDDFASPTYASDLGPAALVRWVDASARRTTTIAIDPPTVGCATLDGLDAGGSPYYFQADATGWADTLTSAAIDLSAQLPDDGVHLVFQYQGGGLGNAPDENDSLVVEFLAPAGGDEGWSQVWSAAGAPMDTFALAFIPITDLAHLQSGFQFRFRNHGTLAGHADLWHVDYVFLDDNIAPDSFNFFEVAFTAPQHTLLRTYHAMPWSHFLTNPAAFMADSNRTLHRNLSSLQADNVTAGFVVRDVETGATEVHENPFSTTVVNPFEPFEVPYYIQAGNSIIDPSGFVFDAPSNDSCATFEVSFYENNIGILYQDRVGVPNNDSIVFTQEFSNYYAYDDGSAEKAYGLTSAGGKLALRYDIVTPDTLLGLAIHFTPYYDSMINHNFLLRAWDDDSGMPGEELGDHYLFHYPEYFTDGHDMFAYYAYDEPLAVEGTVHVGMVQEAEFSLNLGLDKNTQFNATRLHYQLGLGADWVASTIEGTVMVRPVFKSGDCDYWTGVSPVNSELTVAPWTLAPNPAQDLVHVMWADGAPEALTIGLYDGLGRLIRSTSAAAAERSAQIAVADLPRGLYLVVVDRSDSRGSVAWQSAQRLILK